AGARVDGGQGGHRARGGGRPARQARRRAPGALPPGAAPVRVVARGRRGGGGGPTASGKRGGARTALYRLQPLLQDSSPDVRAAVAGALVRACGDLALPFVQPMFKERDDRALVAMAPELGRLKSPESADLLAKMMTRPGSELRLAVARGLADRK